MNTMDELFPDIIIDNRPLSVLLILLAIIAIIYYIGFLICVSKVKKNSILYNSLLILNDEYKNIFIAIEKCDPIYYECGSYKQYKNRNNKDTIFSYLCGYMKEQPDFWNDIYIKLCKNRKSQKEYTEKYTKLKNELYGSSYIESKGFIPITEKWYKKREDIVFNKAILNPITEIYITCIIYYTSPKGKNHYSDEWEFPFNDIIKKMQSDSADKRKIAYQRALMNNSKRYDILKRDNFTCKVCGRSADDGAKLEVDHIIPVSKGGKTIDSNLQTLCHECNQGKLDKL